MPPEYANTMLTIMSEAITIQIHLMAVFVLR